MSLICLFVKFYQLSFFFRHWIIALAAPRMAPANSSQPEPEAFNGAVNPQSLKHIVGTGGLETAVFPKQRREKNLVKPYQQYQRDN